MHGLREAIEQEGAACLVTILEVKGSAPREAGAKMTVSPGGTLYGTVGGGNLEKETRAHAMDLLRDEAAGEAPVAPQTEKFRLCPQVRQCCGGSVSVLYEIFRAPDTLTIFGAGHVAHEVASVADGLGFAITVVDTRPDWNNADRFPRARRVLSDSVEHARSVRRGSVLVMTHDHDLDFAIIDALLGKGLDFVGLIGSETKRRRFDLRLTPERSAELVCPIGLFVGGKAPREIAVSVVAQLLERRGRLSRRS